MIEFNPDGSIKLPHHMVNRQREEEQKMSCQHCMKIKRNLVSTSPPKKCVLEITLSKPIIDSFFVENLYNYFKQNASTPTNIKKIDSHSFEIEIGTDFKRCSDCSSLISKYREHLSGNIIEEKGNCTFQTRVSQNWSDEDYFD